MKIIASLCVTAALLAPAPIAFAHDHDHHHDAAAPAAAGDVSVTGAWTRATPGPNGAAYATLSSAGADDRLVAVKGDVAASIEIHEATMNDGVMQMRRVESVAVPAKGEAVLKPGGHHVMLMGLKAPLKQGEEITLTFVFEKAGEISVVLPVMAPGARPGAEHEHER